MWSELQGIRHFAVLSIVILAGYEAFMDGKLEAINHLARTVHDLYFEPYYEHRWHPQPVRSRRPGTTQECCIFLLDSLRACYNVETLLHQ
jgi:hypothetical protein